LSILSGNVYTQIFGTFRLVHFSAIKYLGRVKKWYLNLLGEWHSYCSPVANMYVHVASRYGRFGETACYFYPENESNMFFRRDSTQLPCYHAWWLRSPKILQLCLFYKMVHHSHSISSFRIVKICWEEILCYCLFLKRFRTRQWGR